MDLIVLREGRTKFNLQLGEYNLPDVRFKLKNRFTFKRKLNLEIINIMLSYIIIGYAITNRTLTTPSLTSGVPAGMSILAKKPTSGASKSIVALSVSI